MFEVVGGSLGGGLYIFSISFRGRDNLFGGIVWRAFDFRRL